MSELNKRVLTPAELKEEADRCEGVEGIDENYWLKVDPKAYARLSRIGASFTLHRIERYQVLPQIHDELERREKARKAYRATLAYCPQSYALEGRILAAQEEDTDLTF
jgi:hypothetical protein